MKRKHWLTQARTQAGASAVDAFRSIIISEQLLGTTEILLVKHTGCGMLTFTNEQAYEIVGKNLGCVLAHRFVLAFTFIAFFPPNLVVPLYDDETNKALQRSPEALEELEDKNLDFLPFPHLEEAVKKDVEFLKATKLVPDSVEISGWVYEVETGKTRRVV
jgi:carbonic anhydrase